jgi:hypothetical protein
VGVFSFSKSEYQCGSAKTRDNRIIEDKTMIFYLLFFIFFIVFIVLPYISI